MVVWDEGFTVRSFDVDQRGRLTPISLFAWMLEAAGRHAQHLGWGIHDLQRQGLTWMLARFRLEVVAFPGWGETVTVRTWPSGVDRLYAMRELRLLDSVGGTAAFATSAWLLLNRTTRRPLRPGPELALMAESTPGRSGELTIAALPDCAGTASGPTFEVRVFDLDINGHATAASLIRWVLESLPVDLLQSHWLRSLELEFRAEALLGDAAAGEFEERDGGFLHRVRRTRDGRELVRGRSTWWHASKVPVEPGHGMLAANPVPPRGRGGQL